MRGIVGCHGYRQSSTVRELPTQFLNFLLEVSNRALIGMGSTQSDLFNPMSYDLLKRNLIRKPEVISNTE